MTVYPHESVSRKMNRSNDSNRFRTSRPSVGTVARGEFETAIDDEDQPKFTGHEAGCLLQIQPVRIDGGLIALHDRPLIIGRDDRCELRLCDQAVSRQHAQIVHDGPDVFVQDFGSTNGTWVNGIRLQAETFLLFPGDRIRFGQHVFKYLAAGDIETQYHAAAYVIMTRDGTTGALNKRSFFESFDREVARALRRRRSLSLILIDVDHFKQVNDSFGHLAGDQILKALSKEMEGVLCGEELLARIGGEEFAILLPEESIESAAERAEYCRHLVETNAYQTSAGSVQITVSLGVASLSEVMLGAGVAMDSMEILESVRSELRTEMMSLCDKRLYDAKSSGRNQVACPVNQSMVPTYCDDES